MFAEGEQDQAQWLTSPANSGLLGKQVSRLMATALDTVEDDKIQELLNSAARALIGQLDISRTMAARGPGSVGLG